uniref:Uncharacterized protein n=1 Tax=Timema cristinae TaxID=61476 RepID=A0A7R9DS66_TIMCR|nr:unnamed protein product [Timema cristinae]
MFIQSQHSNTSGGVALQHIHKKRRLEHQQQQVDYSNGDNLYALNAGGIVNNLNQTVVQRHVQRTLNTNNNVQNKSPNGGVPQQFIRASTIKLLDTYQRCGQKLQYVGVLPLTEGESEVDSYELASALSVNVATFASDVSMYAPSRACCPPC